MILKKGDLDNLTRSVEVVELKENAEEFSNILMELKNELEADKKLLALSAPQIGKNYRIMALKFNDEIKFIFNPLIVHRENLILCREKNISCGRSTYIIPRFDKVEFIYMQSSGIPEQLELTGLAAHLFQQMNDFLDGIMLSDYGLQIDKDFDDLSEEDKNTILQQYLDSYKDIVEVLKKEINENDDLREQQKTIDFMTSVALGETKLKQPQPNRATRRAQEKMAKKLKRQLKEHGVSV